MNVDIRLPNITGQTPEEQMVQVKSYLYQFAEQLQWAFRTLESGDNTNIVQTKSSAPAKSDSADPKDFHSLKALVIKTAEVVEVMTERVTSLLNLTGKYYAKSPFGTFVEHSSNRIAATDKKISQEVGDAQSLYDADGNLRVELLVNGHIFSGIIEYAQTGEAIVGVEVGQVIRENGVDKFNKFARFTADRLSFYDSYSNMPVAYISNFKLFITEAEITGNLKVGRYVLDPSNGLALRWEE